MGKNTAPMMFTRSCQYCLLKYMVTSSCDGNAKLHQKYLSVRNFMAYVVVILAATQNFLVVKEFGLLHIFYKYQIIILIVMASK